MLRDPEGRTHTTPKPGLRLKIPPNFFVKVMKSKKYSEE